MFKETHPTFDLTCRMLRLWHDLRRSLGPVRFATTVDQSCFNHEKDRKEEKCGHLGLGQSLARIEFLFSNTGMKKKDMFYCGVTS